ncbi:MAG: heme lyase CcmF/NrfE family subunit [Bacillota bacterium]|nr:MAG: heme lyase CcmF/NrfE family subunit [Bacillota bacterium]
MSAEAAARGGGSSVTFPTALIVLALMAAAYGTGALSLGAFGRGRRELVEHGRVAALLSAGALTVASGLLIRYLAVSDFRLAYVAAHTNRALPAVYKIAAFWAGQEGSFLLWALVLGWFAVYVSRVTWRRAPELSARALTFILATNVFFLLVMVARANPFTLASPVPDDGIGLNPLLQNFGMLAHPVTLYLGYVGFTVPFAFAVAYMLGGGSGGKSTGGGKTPRKSRRGSLDSAHTGSPGAEWLTLTRSFTIFSWLFLSIGIILGMQWAYVELGWGGYWAWDPVENASLIPWLTATAFLHTALVQERKGTLAGWNVALIAATFFLTILGTFLTRTGVVSSVHAFAESGLETYFLPFMAVIVLGTGYVVARNWSRVKETKPLGSFLSREAAVVLAGFLFVAFAAVVLWGTLVPLFSRLASGREVSVAAPFYLRSAVPIGAVTVVLLGLCQQLGWSRTSTGPLLRVLAAALGVSVAGSFALAWFLAPGSPAPNTLWGFGAAFLVVLSALVLFARDMRARRSSTGEGPLRALAALIELSPRRYGALIVHLAIAAMALGFAGTPFRQEATFVLLPGQTATAAGRELKFTGLSAEHLPHRVSVVASIEVRGDGLASLRPEKQYYPNYESAFTEVAVLGGLVEDIYVILEAWSPDGSASLRVIREPLVAWIWIGGYLLAAGTLLSAWPRSLGVNPRAPAGSPNE